MLNEDIRQARDVINSFLSCHPGVHSDTMLMSQIMIDYDQRHLLRRPLEPSEARDVLGQMVENGLLVKGTGNDYHLPS